MENTCQRNTNQFDLHQIYCSWKSRWEWWLHGRQFLPYNHIIRPSIKPLAVTYLVFTLGTQHTLMTTLLCNVFFRRNAGLSHQEESCEGAPVEPSHSPHALWEKAGRLLYHCPGSNCWERSALKKKSATYLMGLQLLRVLRVYSIYTVKKKKKLQIDQLYLWKYSRSWYSKTAIINSWIEIKSYKRSLIMQNASIFCAL